MTKQPLPCPFCGIEPRTTSTRAGFKVSCGNEHCAITVFINLDGLTKADAIDLWNKRAEAKS